MKRKSSMSLGERSARSELARLVSWERLIRGNLLLMKHTCGKVGCHCQRGEKHESFYLAQSYKGKKRMVYIPQGMEKEIRQWVKQYRKSRALIEKISRIGWQEIEFKKQSFR
jgi:hypothetical protein